MGRVWRAADEMLDRQVAVKEMRIDGLDPEDTRTRRERTLREARATARMDHPNVVRVYDVVDEGERLWIVMELVAGRSLEQLVAEDGPLGPREAARIGLELVVALRQVHAGGVLHRDIKPGNVLVERSGHRVVLTDFGIAAIQDAKALTMVGMLVGSPDYMAPERISGRPQGPPSDVWSLGATLCAALGGRSPFSRSTTLATLHAVLYEEPELPASAGDLREVLAALLEKEPSTRPGLEELEEALGRLVFPGAESGAESGAYGPAPDAAPDSDSRSESRSGSRSGSGSGCAPEPEAASQPEPAPVQDAIPTQHTTFNTPSTPSTPSSSNASTEVPSELRAEIGTPSPPPSAERTTQPQRGHRHHHRRLALAATSGVVVAGVTLWLVVAAIGGSPGDKDAGSSTSSAATGPTGSASPTVEGTSRPPSLPPGAHREAGGYAWVTPKGWRRDLKTGSEVHYTSPDGKQEIAAKSSLAKGDLMKTWQTSEENARQGQDYQKIRLEETTFRGRQAVVWEYVFSLQGVRWHAQLLGFDADGKSYQINTWYQPDIEDQALKVYEQVKRDFTVL